MKNKMKLYLRIGEAAEYLGVSTKTMRRWERKRKIRVAMRTEGNHRRYELEEIERMKKGHYKQEKENQDTTRKIALIYGRVSAPKQKEDLVRQITLLEKEVEKDNYIVGGIYKDIGSGLNDNRNGLRRLILECMKNRNITRVYITFDQMINNSLNYISTKNYMLGIRKRLNVAN